ncbi:hypothetical protein K435DRAFT_31774 [Dendrothele bispora CBS 962.96]|uniref:F-box domain-containing protein n=1 Tax=Dendrothele bispora (strain CBS 962.96) TaxID=1314807 RepID=A0A4S8M7R8_DENBC|nr:hypothetical protein K435DRAFT_31774 [Dendrothele bispora CBS 962.96]
MPAVLTQHRLPTELQEYVIDLLSGTRENLLTTSLVSKHWRYHSYGYLFPSVTLDGRSVEAFRSFLDMSFSRSVIFSRVRRVRIIGGYSLDSSWTASRRQDLRAILSYLTSKQLQNLSNLSMEALNWSQLGSEVIFYLTKLAPMITSLELQNVQFPHARSYSDFVGAFVSLRTFGFSNVECAQGEIILVRPNQGVLLSRHTVTSESEQTRIKCSLVLRSSEEALEKNLSCLYSEVLPQETSREITKLGTQTSLMKGNASFLLKSLGPLLTRLQIASRQNIFSDQIIASLDISNNTSLQYLSFYSPDRVFGMISWLLPILRQVTACNLRVLEIVFASSHQFHLDQRLLRFIGKELERPQFSQLEIIHFLVNRIRGRCDAVLENNIVKHVKETLSDWNKKGVLRVNFL